MRKIPGVFLVLLALSMFPVFTQLAKAAPTGKYFDTIVTIVMENTGINATYDYCSGGATSCSSSALGYVIGNTNEAPFMNQFYSTRGFAESYSGISHPSQPNYIALVSGNTYGISSDGNCCWQLPSSDPNLLDRFGSSISYSLFAEGASGSGTCSFSPPRSADHFGFLEFAANNDNTRCQNYLTTSSGDDHEFLQALNTTTPKNYYWLTPTDASNCHNPQSSQTYCDTHLHNMVMQILNSTTFLTTRAALFIIFDEGGGSYSSDYVYTVFAGPVVKTSFRSVVAESHYSYVKMLENNWALQCMNTNDCSSSTSNMSEYFQDFQGNFGACNASEDPGWNCNSYTGLGGSSDTIDSAGILHTGLFAQGIGNYQYASSKRGSFPWDSPILVNNQVNSTDVCDPNASSPTGHHPDYANLPANSTGITQVDAAFTPVMLPTTGSRFNVFITVYYWLPITTPLTLTTGGVTGTFRCLDTQVRIEWKNGSFQPATNSTDSSATFCPGNIVNSFCQSDSFGWNQTGAVNTATGTLSGTVSLGQTYILTANVRTQCIQDLTAWGDPSSSPHCATAKLSGVEIGVGGYNFPGLQVAWPMQVQLTGCNFKGDVTNAPVSGVTEPSVDILDIARFAYAYGTSIQQPIPVNSALTYPPSYFKYFVDITT